MWKKQKSRLLYGKKQAVILCIRFFCPVFAVLVLALITVIRATFTVSVYFSSAMSLFLILFKA